MSERVIVIVIVIVIVYLYCALLSKGRYWSSYNKGFEFNKHNKLTKTTRLQNRMIYEKTIH